ncbi:MAG: hypothetical protein ACUVTY_11950 [Armatimonadota bacterium]
MRVGRWLFERYSNSRTRVGFLGCLAQANAFIYLPPGESAYPEGTLVKVLPIAPLEGCA